jgi:hypothetical protein
MLINYQCGQCHHNEYAENPPMKSQNYMQEFYSCTCSKCSTVNVVMCYKPIQVQLDFPPFRNN